MKQTPRPFCNNVPEVYKFSNHTADCKHSMQQQKNVPGQHIHCKFPVGQLFNPQPANHQHTLPIKNPHNHTQQNHSQKAEQAQQPNIRLQQYRHSNPDQYKHTEERQMLKRKQLHRQMSGDNFSSNKPMGPEHFQKKPPSNRGSFTWKCPNGHQLQPHTSLPVNYSYQMFKCCVCNKDKIVGDIAPAWRCVPCKFDMCNNCTDPSKRDVTPQKTVKHSQEQTRGLKQNKEMTGVDKRNIAEKNKYPPKPQSYQQYTREMTPPKRSLVCSNGHVLGRFLQLPPRYSGKFACNICTQIYELGGLTAVWHCNSCDYDMCQRCAKK